MIELTPEQRQALEEHNGEPVRVVDPTTHDAYFLVRAEAFERMAGVPQPPVDEEPSLIHPQILRSMQAFWRDLPELLKSGRNRGKWVAYHGDERVGIAADEDDLVRECIRRGLGNSDYHLDVIEPKPNPPWHVEDVEFGIPEFGEESPAPR